MIVLDDQISFAPVAKAIARWYPGAVRSVRIWRPNEQILDDDIPRYLHSLRQPTFVTINYVDFWKSHLVHPAYCVICLKLTQNELLQVPSTLRQVLSLPDYHTKARRMGKVISWTPQEIRHYE